MTACYRRSHVDLAKCQKGDRFDTHTEDSPGVWTKHAGLNCWKNNGAETVLPEPFSTSITVAGCKKACQTDGECTAVVVAAAGGPVPGGLTDDVLLDGLIKAVNADGFNGDTMGSVPEQFYTTSVRIGHPIAIEPEGGGRASDGNGNWDTMGWGYWKSPPVPMVDSWKWFDPRRMTNICERWSKDHTNALQYALFNGDGFESWENVWGTWNGITQRDGEAIRRVGSALRFLGGRGFLQSPGWVPHSPTAAPGTLFASMWPLGADSGRLSSGAPGAPGSVAWTVVNRGKSSGDFSGPALNVSGS